MPALRRKWLIRNGSISAILLILWNTVLVKPLRILVVFFHEIFHALASLYSGLPILVYSAGYLGTATLDGILRVSGHNYPLKRSLYLIIGLIILETTILFVRNPFGWAYGMVAGLFFVLLFFKELRFSAYITDLVGVMCILYTLYDFLDILMHETRNDAVILQETSGLPIRESYLPGSQSALL